MREALSPLLVIAIICYGGYVMVGRSFGLKLPHLWGRHGLIHHLLHGLWHVLEKLLHLAWHGVQLLFGGHHHGGEGASFLGWFDRRRLLNSHHDGLVIDGHHGRLSAEDSFLHLALVAPTGAGKTTRYIIPNLFTLENCSIVVTDPSGEIHARTSGHLAAKGFDILVINPASAAASLRYNPLCRIHSDTQAQEIAHCLIRSANKDYDREPFWNSGAERILDVFIRTLKTRGDPRYLNLPNVLHLLQHFGEDGSALDDFIAQHADDATYQQYRAFVGGNPKVMQSWISVATNSLALLNNPDVARFMAGDDLDFTALRKQPTVIYLMLPSDKISFYSFIMNLFYTQLFAACMERIPAAGDLPIYCLMDEFGHSSIPFFETIITTIRKYRVSLSLVLQSVSQLATNYGKDKATTILEGGVSSRLFYSGLDMESAQRVERLLGRKRTITERKDGTRQVQEENLMNADRIRTMPDDQALFVFRNKEPAQLHTVPYFKNSHHARAAKLPPHPLPAAPQAAPVPLVPLTDSPSEPAGISDTGA